VGTWKRASLSSSSSSSDQESETSESGDDDGAAGGGASAGGVVNHDTADKSEGVVASGGGGGGRDEDGGNKVHLASPPLAKSGNGDFSKGRPHSVVARGRGQSSGKEGGVNAGGGREEVDSARENRQESEKVQGCRGSTGGGQGGGWPYTLTPKS